MNIAHPNAWWSSRNFLKPSGVQILKLMDSRLPFFYLNVCLPATCQAPFPMVSLRNKSACASPGSVPLPWLQKLSRPLEQNLDKTLHSFALPVNKLKIITCQWVAGWRRICTLLSLAFCLMHNFKVPCLAVTFIIINGNC